MLPREQSESARAGLPLARGHTSLFPRLRPLDVEFMKALHQRVNIVPILAKADTLTPPEVERKKRKVREAGGGGGAGGLPERTGSPELWAPHVFARSERRLSALESRSISSQTVTLMRMRTSNYRTKP